MKPLSRSSFAWVAAALAVLMIATRLFGHVGDALHLPDASMAVFFLGGLYLRRHLAFAGYLLLAVLIDWVAIREAGVSDFCVTAAYVFLLPAYAALWYGGRLYAPRLDGGPASLAGALAVALVGAAACYAISGGAFYWLGGRYAHPHMAEYLARAWRWGPMFVRVTLCYVAAGLALHTAARSLAHRRHERQAARA